MQLRYCRHGKPEKNRIDRLGCPIMTWHSNDLAYLRSCAEEARAIAERLKIADARRIMYEIARKFELRAERAERQLAIENTGQARSAS
jgi:hypothetical protein